MYRVVIKASPFFIYESNDVFNLFAYNYAYDRTTARNTVRVSKNLNKIVG